MKSCFAASNFLCYLLSRLDFIRGQVPLPQGGGTQLIAHFFYERLRSGCYKNQQQMMLAKAMCKKKDQLKMVAL